MAFPYNSVIWQAGADNIGGLSTRVYFVPTVGVESWPEYDDDGVTLRGDITLKSGAKFIDIYTTYKTAALTAEAAGDIDGKVSKLSGEFFHPGNNTEAAQFARAVQNTPGILIFVDGEGRNIVVGSVVHPAILAVSHNTGKTPEDRRGFTFKFEAYSTRHITFYTGAGLED